MDQKNLIKTHKSQCLFTTTLGMKPVASMRATSKHSSLPSAGALVPKAMPINGRMSSIESYRSNHVSFRMKSNVTMSAVGNQNSGEMNNVAGLKSFNMGQIPVETGMNMGSKTEKIDTLNTSMRAATNISSEQKNKFLMNTSKFSAL